MSLSNLQDLCKQLKLAHLPKLVDEKNDPIFTSQLEELLKLEILHRQSAKLARLVKQAGFSSLKTFEGYSVNGKIKRRDFGKQYWRILYI